MKKEQKKEKKKNPFNRLPINPPKGWREQDKLPDKKFRMIPQ